MFSRILVPLDGSQLSERALPHAVRMAQIFNARLMLLQVLEAEHTDGLIDPLSWQIRKAESDLYLRDQVRLLAEREIDVTYQILEGRTPEMIVQFAQENEIDLVVISSHGRGGLSRWDISSVVAKVVEKIYLPLLLIRAYQPLADDEAQSLYKKLLLPVDNSKRAECALQVAQAIANANQAEIVLAHVLRRPEVPQTVPETEEMNRLVEDFMALSRKASATYLEDLHARTPTPSRMVIVKSDSVTRGLHNLAEEEAADLLVICAHGQGGPSDWPYGTIAKHYIEHGTRSVLVMQDIPPSLAKPTLVEQAAKQQGSR